MILLTLSMGQGLSWSAGPGPTASHTGPDCAPVEAGVALVWEPGGAPGKRATSASTFKAECIRHVGVRVPSGDASPGSVTEQNVQDMAPAGDQN